MVNYGGCLSSKINVSWGKKFQSILIQYEFVKKEQLFPLHHYLQSTRQIERSYGTPDKISILILILPDISVIRWLLSLD